MKKWKIAACCAVFLLMLVLGWHFSSRDTATPASLPAHPSETVEALTQNRCPNKLVSWNIANFGRSKTDADIERMAILLSDADIVAVQEVTAGKDFGVQAVAKLADRLSRKGAEWDYIVSESTDPPSPGVERYAYLFRKNTVSINRGHAHLVGDLSESIDREPYTLLFQLKNGTSVQVFTIHAVPTAKKPINEVRELIGSHEVKNAERAIIAGDFNLDHDATDPLFASIGFVGHITSHTSLRRKVQEENYFSRQYDNVYTKGVEVCSAGVIDFVSKWFAPVTNESLGRALGISDHLPVFITFE